MKQLILVSLLLMTSIGCRRSMTSPQSLSSPSPIRPLDVTSTTSGTSGHHSSLGAMSVGFDSGFAVKLAAFPPRNELLAFRQQLETVYQTQLRRSRIPTFVDIEGTTVWTQEYLRYRLSGCSHAQTVQIVLSEIDGAAGPGDCGGSVPFPARNEPVEFRSNALESKYRDGLHRSPVQSFVDIEGDSVWITEYLRYRVCGSDHATAAQFVVAQINNALPSPGCPVTIGFDTLQSNNAPFLDYREAGFTIAAASGGWTVLTSFGHPGPFILIRRSAAEAAIAAEIRITAGGSPFSFSSVDLYSSLTPIPYAFTGLRNANTVFTVAGTVPWTFGAFATVVNPNSSDRIDTLLIRITNPVVCCDNPAGLDNIVLLR